MPDDTPPPAPGAATAATAGSGLRDLRLLDRFRIAHPSHGRGDATCGAFLIRSVVTGQEMKVIASSGEGWDHVSVSFGNRNPLWTEMEQVKRLFWRDDRTAMQLHVPPRDHISLHPHTLHLWSPQNAAIPRPPGWMVG